MTTTFKPGDQVIFIKRPGYSWVEKYIDSDLIQVVKEVIETDGHILLKLEDIRTHEIPVPAFCFDYETDCESAWCGESHTKEEIQANFEKAVKNGYSKSFNEYLLDYL